MFFEFVFSFFVICLELRYSFYPLTIITEQILVYHWTLIAGKFCPVDTYQTLPVSFMMFFSFFILIYMYEFSKSFSVQIIVGVFNRILICDDTFT